MKTILFFATDKDLGPVLARVENDGPLQYVQTGQILKAEWKRLPRGADLPGLGIATSDSAISSQSYLVAEESTRIVARPIKGPAGVERFCIDQMKNPETVTLTPGGMRDGVLLHGRVATASDAVQSEVLMKRFRAALKKEFTKIKAFWVGGEALALLEAGKRLTISVQSPQEFDLRK